MPAHPDRHTPSTFNTAGWGSALADDGTVHLHLRGEFDYEEAEALASDLLELCRGGHRLALDLGQVQYIGARGLTALVTAAAEAERNGGVLYIHAAAPIVRRLLQVTELSFLLAPGNGDPTSTP